MAKFHCEIETTKRIPGLIPDLTVTTSEFGIMRKRYRYTFRSLARYEKAFGMVNLADVKIHRMAAVSKGAL